MEWRKLMRYKGYLRETLETGLIECIDFGYAQYGEADVAYTPACGMHESAALGLVNKWNGATTGYKYWIT
jgi:hypothetical protein